MSRSPTQSDITAGLSTAGRRSAAGARPGTGTTTWASVSPAVRLASEQVKSGESRIGKSGRRSGGSVRKVGWARADQGFTACAVEPVNNALAVCMPHGQRRPTANRSACSPRPHRPEGPGRDGPDAAPAGWMPDSGGPALADWPFGLDGVGRSRRQCGPICRGSALAHPTFFADFRRRSICHVRR